MNKFWRKSAITNKPAYVLAFTAVYATVVLGVLLVFAIAQPSDTSIIGITVLLAFVPLLCARLEYTLLALIIFRPLIDIYSGYSVIAYNSLQLNMSSVLAIAVCIWGAYIILRDRMELRTVPGILWIGLFLLVGTVSSLLGSDVVGGFGELIRMSSFVIFYIIGWHLVRRDKHFVVWAINALALSVVVPITLALYQLLTFSGLSWGNLSNRVYGTFGHPNALGFYLVLVLIIVLIKYISAPFQHRSLVYPWVLAGGSIALLFTYTRGAWIGIGVALLILGIGHYRKQLMIVLVTLGLLFVGWQSLNAIVLNVFNVSLSSIPIVSRLTSNPDEQSSIQYRLDIFNAMAPRTLEKPILGHGLASFITLRKQGDIGLYDDPEAHNDYLRLAIETGFVGLLFYILFYAAILRQAIVNFAITQTNSWQKNYSLGLIAIVIAFLAMSVADNIIQGTALMWALMMVLGGLLAIVKPRS